MGNSFKLQKGGSAKDQARSAGVFAMAVGIIFWLFVWPLPGFLLAVLGFVFFLASFAASE